MEKIALLLIDIQNDYFSSFKDAKLPLENMEKSTINTSKILKFFRNKHLDIIHIKHENLIKGRFLQKDTKGSEIHESVKPLRDECVIIKNFPNSFKNTRLKQTLHDLNISSLVIVGAMSHMCIDSTIRAAKDFGFNCVVVNDAVSTKDLEFKGIKVKAKDVHNSFMLALDTTYAKIQNTKDVLKDLLVEVK